MSNNSESVLLISMPFAEITIPSVQLAILEKYCKERNVIISSKHLYLKKLSAKLWTKRYDIYPCGDESRGDGLNHFGLCITKLHLSSPQAMHSVSSTLTGFPNIHFVTPCIYPSWAKHIGLSVFIPTHQMQGDTSRAAPSSQS